MTDSNIPLNNVRIVDFGDEQIQLDPKRLVFNDATISKFMEDLSIWYDYYSSKTAKAEELQVRAESKHESLRAEKFLEAKGEGLSDKAAEAFASKDLTVEAAKSLAITAKGNLKQMKEFIRSLDKAHEMAQNRGYMIRKEMDKLRTDIYETTGGKRQIDVSDIIGNSN